MAEPTVLVIGNFDGVHRGHQALVARARHVALRHDAAVRVVTFAQHPATVLRPTRIPPAILHPDQRQQALEAAGATVVDWLAPSQQLLEQSPRQFIESWTRRYDVRAIVEGGNFRFGRGRAGDIQTLRAFGDELGFEVHVVDDVDIVFRDKTVNRISSTLVRWLIEHGRMSDVTLCLDRPWALRGVVVAGEHRGRELGVPTANLDTSRQMYPANGVYAAMTEIDGRYLPVAVSVGVKPTFGQVGRVVEAHLLDWEADLYGRTLTLHMVRWLRDQYPFPDVGELKAQLRRDIRQVRELARRRLLDPTATVLADA